jgi:hypothetical protein
MTVTPVNSSFVGQDCIICYQSFELSEKVKTLVCNHFFHEECIDRWLHDHATCPMCRSHVVQPPGSAPTLTVINIAFFLNFVQSAVEESSDDDSFSPIDYEGPEIFSLVNLAPLSYAIRNGDFEAFSHHLENLSHDYGLDLKKEAYEMAIESDNPLFFNRLLEEMPLDIDLYKFCIPECSGMRKPNYLSQIVSRFPLDTATKNSSLESLFEGVIVEEEDADVVEIFNLLTQDSSDLEEELSKRIFLTALELRSMALLESCLQKKSPDEALCLEKLQALSKSDDDALFYTFLKNYPLKEEALRLIAENVLKNHFMAMLDTFLRAIKLDDSLKHFMMKEALVLENAVLIQKILDTGIKEADRDYFKELTCNPDIITLLE